jgi:hypothetical protein
VVEIVERPALEALDTARLSGWIHPGLAVGGAELLVERIGDSAPAQALPVELAPAAWTRVEGAPAGATFFRAPSLWTRHLPRGHWRFTLRLFNPEGALIGDRIVAVETLERRVWPSQRTLVFWALAGVFALGLGSNAATWATIVFAVLQGLSFLTGIHPALDRARNFPPTLTEEILARELGTRRYFAEPGVLPANTGMVRGLRAVDGYDGLDPASFDGYRSAVLRPGVQALLGFSPRQARLDAAPLRLLGVGALVLAAPIDAPGFELIAAPDGSAQEVAECWIYRAVDPLPRAFCVARTLPRDAVLAKLSEFDPLEAAFLEDGASFVAATPFSSASVREVAWHNDSVELEVELDGQGLLVLTEQHFPGWSVEVNGVQAALLRADSIFRAVALDAGKSRVVFRYAPLSWRLGLGLAACGLLALALGAWLLQRRALPGPQA